LRRKRLPLRSSIEFPLRVHWTISFVGARLPCVRRSRWWRSLWQGQERDDQEACDRGERDDPRGWAQAVGRSGRLDATLWRTQRPGRHRDDGEDEGPDPFARPVTREDV